jgi:hypothetical protein
MDTEILLTLDTDRGTTLGCSRKGQGLGRSRLSENEAYGTPWRKSRLRVHSADREFLSRELLADVGVLKTVQALILHFRSFGLTAWHHNMSLVWDFIVQASFSLIERAFFCFERTSGPDLRPLLQPICRSRPNRICSDPLAMSLHAAFPTLPMYPHLQSSRLTSKTFQRAGSNTPKAAFFVPASVLA